MHFRQKQSAASSASATRCKLLNATCLAMAVEEMSRNFLIGVLYDAMISAICKDSSRAAFMEIGDRPNFITACPERQDRNASFGNSFTWWNDP